MTVLNGKAKYFRNITRNANHWILLKLVGVKSNRMGLGAQIAITAEDGSRQYNHATTAVGYAYSATRGFISAWGHRRWFARSISAGRAVYAKRCEMCRPTRFSPSRSALERTSGQGGPAPDHLAGRQ